MIRAATLAVVLAACGREPKPQVTLWHAYGGVEKATLDQLADRWNHEHSDVQLRVVGVPYDALPDKITSAIPNGNGPDLFVFAHDRIGDWAEARILEPIEFFVDDARADHFDTAALTAMAYRGSLYGLPLAVKSLALFYRTDRLNAPPATTDELLAIARGLTDTNAGRFGLAYENTKLYGNAAWIFGFGGRIFDDDGRLAMVSTGATRGLDFARALAAFVPPDASGPLVASLFREGRAAMVLSGPWFLGSLDATIPWRVAPLPVISATGRPAAPFLGAEGLMMSARAGDKAAAFAVMAFLTSDASAIERAVAAHQVVPNRAAYDDPRVGKDAVLAAFRRQAEVAEPMPSTPAMQMVWTPYDHAIQRALGQGVDSARALADAEAEIAGYIRGAR